MSATKLNPITIKKLKSAIANGDGIKKACMSIGYTANSAEEHGRDIIRRSGVITDMVRAMERKGITDDALAETLSDGLKCNRVISAVIVSKNADERTNDFIEIPDHPTRHTYLNTALKLKNHFPASKIDVGVEGQITYEFVLNKLIEAKDKGLIREDVPEIDYEITPTSSEDKQSANVAGDNNQAGIPNG